MCEEITIEACGGKYGQQRKKLWKDTVIWLAKN